MDINSVLMARWWHLDGTLMVRQWHVNGTLMVHSVSLGYVNGTLIRTTITLIRRCYRGSPHDNPPNLREAAMGGWVGLGGYGTSIPMASQHAICIALACMPCHMLQEDDSLDAGRIKLQLLLQKLCLSEMCCAYSFESLLPEQLPI